MIDVMRSIKDAARSARDPESRARVDLAVDSGTSRRALRAGIVSRGPAANTGHGRPRTGAPATRIASSALLALAIVAAAVLPRPRPSPRVGAAGPRRGRGDGSRSAPSRPRVGPSAPIPATAATVRAGLADVAEIARLAAAGRRPGRRRRPARSRPGPAPAGPRDGRSVALRPGPGRRFEAARRLAPDDPLVLVGIGGLQLGQARVRRRARHRPEALDRGTVARRGPRRRGRRARRARPVRRGRRGRRPSCSRSASTSRRSPGSRISRELHGNLAGAIAAMRQAADVARPRAGEHRLRRRRSSATCSSTPAIRQAAAAAYEAALALVPDHAAGDRRPRAAGGRAGRPRRGDRAASSEPPRSCRCPSTSSRSARPRRRPARRDAAAQSYDLARAEIQLFQAAGVDVDLELALFEADHGDPGAALGHATPAYAGDADGPGRRRPGLGTPPRWAATRTLATGRRRRSGSARSIRSSATTPAPSTPPSATTRPPAAISSSR